MAEKKINTLTVERLRAILHYETCTGHLVWKSRCPVTPQVARWNGRFSGKIAGALDKDGFIAVSIDGTRYRAHELAWRHHFGVDLAREISHKNGDRVDNSIGNLQECVDTNGMEWSSAADVRKLLRYDPASGHLYWRAATKNCGRRENSRNARYNGRLASTKRPDGGFAVSIYGRKFLAHRLIWFYVYGHWPQDQIDHINGDRSDNRIDNLREANNSQNNCNRSLQSNNTSGHKGVHFNKRMQKWMSYIQIDGKRTDLGFFGSKEEAHAAYANAAPLYHGEFARVP